MSALLTEDILVSSLHCPLKGYLKFNGQKGTPSDYEIFIDTVRAEFILNAQMQLQQRYSSGSPLQGTTVTQSLLQHGEDLILNARIETERYSLRLHGLHKVPGTSPLGPFYYVPILFYERQRIHKAQKQILALWSIALGDVQGRLPERGMILYGPAQKMVRVFLTAQLQAMSEFLQELQQLPNCKTPPKLVLNDHCQVCEFRQRCTEQATQADELSLLRGMGEKEIKKYHRKGIFTITQLSYTFRPRKKAKRVQPQHRAHSFALRALAIREQKIYVFGKPDLPRAPVHIYLDVEGDSERRFVYLMGILIVENGSERHVALWADHAGQEQQMFQQFLNIIRPYDAYCLFYYGSYESSFLLRMRKQARRKMPVNRAIQKSLNVLSFLHSSIYFPTYTNGLKEVGRFLGCTWSEANASGLQSLLWRAQWEKTQEEQWKQILIQYNYEDCRVLRRLTETLYALCTQDSGNSFSATDGQHLPPISLVQDLVPYISRPEWSAQQFSSADFAYINRCAYFDYQQEKVLLRSTQKSQRRRASRLRRHTLKRLPPNTTVEIQARKCPRCGNTQIGRDDTQGRTKFVFDLKVSPAGIRRRVIACQAVHHKCNECHKRFFPQKLKHIDPHGHALKSWAMYHHVAHRMSFQNLEAACQELFGLSIDFTVLHMFKAFLARYYQSTYQHLLKRMTAAPFLHVDETEVNLRKTKGYVWVFTTLEEVVFVYRPTRETEFLHELLHGYQGVLISDFYAGYDGLPCQQQKCLIHLLRDMNGDVFKNPYDEEYKRLAAEFGQLLRAIVGTIDQYGLRQWHLNKHRNAVDRFYANLRHRHYHSEIAEQYQKRFLRYQEKLFTFLHCDGVPWNNNHAEHAIRHFAQYRVIVNGKMTELGLKDYLVLLSIYQTCRYKDVSFFKFLLSREHEIRRFSPSVVRKSGLPIFDVYPSGFPWPYHKFHKKASKGQRARLKEERRLKEQSSVSS